MALGWVVVVVAVATVTFIVVDRAGRGVGQASGASALPGGTSATGTSPAPAPTATAGSPGPTGTGPTTPATTAGVSSRTESFTTAGGTVVASCDGDQVTLESITVRDGWRFEQEAERGRLEVKFESRQDDDVDDAELRLACVDGTPTPVDD
ncbi:MAG: hypothetical protein WCA30_00480 [Dermatophilaceae bacterium]